MSYLEKGLKSSCSKKRGGTSGRSRKLIRKKQKRRLALSKKEKQTILETCLLVEGQRTERLLLSVESMLSATRDLIQNNEVIPAESVQALKEQNEILSKEIKELNTSIFQKFKRKIRKNWTRE